MNTHECEQFEQYLDGALEPAQVAAVEALVRDNPAAAGRLERLRQQRALRQAALASYAPPAAESAALADAWLEQMREPAEAPVGRIRPAWWRTAAAVAAMLLIAAGSFWAGRNSVPSQQLPIVQNGDNAAPAGATAYVVQIRGTDGKLIEREFATLSEAMAYANQVEVQTPSTPATDDADWQSGVF